MSLTLDQFINKPSSEKLLLAHIEPSRRQFGWTVHSGSVYKKLMTNYVISVHLNATLLTRVAALADVTQGTWFFNEATLYLYMQVPTGSVDPDPGYRNSSLSVGNFTLVTFRLFFSNYAGSFSYNLQQRKEFLPTAVNTTNDTIYYPSHSFRTNDLVKFYSDTTAPVGLTINNSYFAIRVDDDYIKLATTEALATAGTNINLTSQGVGNHSLLEGRIVPYNPIISSTSEFGSSLDSERHGAAVESSSTISFYNNDLYFDDIFDKLIWENKNVTIYLTHRDMPLVDKIILFKGKITGKAFSPNDVSFEITDFIKDLSDRVSLTRYTEDDFEGTEHNHEILPEDSTQGKFKRRIYGRCGAVLLDPGDRVESVSTSLSGGFTPAADIDGLYIFLDGLSTDIHTRLSPGDNITGKYDSDNSTLNDFPSPFEVVTLSRINIDANTEMDVDFFWAPTVANTLEIDPSAGDFDSTNVTVGDTVIINVLSPAENRGLWLVNAKLAGGILRLERIGYTGGVGALNVTINQGDTPSIIAISQASAQRVTVSAELPVHTGSHIYRFLPTGQDGFNNRKFFLTHHINQQLTATITTIESSAGYILVDDTTEFRTNDIITIGTDEVELKITNIAPDTGRFFLELIPTLAIPSPTATDLSTFLTSISVSDTITRPCVQNLYHNKETLNKATRFPASTYQVQNDSTGSYIVFDTAVEKELSFYADAGYCQWLLNSRAVYSLSGLGIQFCKSRDFILGPDLVEYEIEEVIGSPNNATAVILRTTFTGASGNYTSKLRRVTYIDDTSNIIADMYGKTANDLATGALIATPSAVVRDLLIEANLEDRLNETSFTDAEGDGNMLVSLMLPLSKSEDAPLRRDVITLLNDTIFGAVYNNNKHEIAYKVLLPGRIRTDLKVLSDEDIIDFQIRVDSSKINETIYSYYNFQDIDRDTGKTEQATITDTGIRPISSNTKYQNLDVSYGKITTNFAELDIYLYNLSDAQIMSQRYAHMSRTSQSIVDIQTKLQTVNLSIGDLIEVSFDRLYTRFGSSADQSKIGMVIDIKKTESGVVVSMDDLGNIFNSQATITADTAATFALSSAIDIRYNAYITDQAGLIDGDDSLYGTNTIA